MPESIECFIEKQASSPSYDDLAPPPSLPPSSIGKLSLFLTLPVCRRSSLLTGEGGGGGGGAKLYDGEEAWYPINHSLLSELYT